LYAVFVLINAVVKKSNVKIDYCYSVLLVMNAVMWDAYLKDVSASDVAVF